MHGVPERKITPPLKIIQSDSLVEEKTLTTMLTAMNSVRAQVRSFSSVPSVMKAAVVRTVGPASA